jgi:hypothetical protein
VGVRGLPRSNLALRRILCFFRGRYEAMNAIPT